MPQISSKHLNAASVFADPSKRRWTVVKLVATIAFVGALVLISVLGVRILNGPSLSGFSLATPGSWTIVTQPGAPSVIAPERALPDVQQPLNGGVADASGFFIQAGPATAWPTGSTPSSPPRPGG